MVANLSLESNKEVMRRKELTHLTRLLDWLEGVGRYYNEGMESSRIMVPANGMVHKLKEELENDGALLFGLIFLAYLDLVGEYFCLLFLFIAFLFLPIFPFFTFCVYFSLLSCFGFALLKNVITPSNFVSL